MLLRTSLLALLALTCAGCDYTVLTTEVGEHVVYHWDASENQVYGGTVAIADGFLEAIPAYYGLPFERTGPTIEYFWGAGLVQTGLCSLRAACTRSYAGSNALTPLFTIYTGYSIDTHELAHTANGGYNAPPFFNEGFAARWQSALIDGDFPYSNQPSALTEAQRRAQFLAEFQVGGLEVERELGFTWWVALETKYGPAKVGEFIAALGSHASMDDVDDALERVFDISLAESAALAAKLPAMTAVVDPACVMQGLPTRVWSGEPLVIDRGDAHDEDGDIANHIDKAIWLFTLEFPEPGVLVEMRVTVPPGTTQAADGFLNLGTCTPSLLDPYSDAPFIRYNPTALSEEPGSIERPLEDGRSNDLAARWTATGRWVGALVATPDADGSIVFPRVEFREPQP